MPNNIPQPRLTVYLIKEVGLLFIIHFIFMESQHAIDANVLASVAVFYVCVKCVNIHICNFNKLKQEAYDPVISQVKRDAHIDYLCLINTHLYKIKFVRQLPKVHVQTEYTANTNS